MLLFLLALPYCYGFGFDTLVPYKNVSFQAKVLDCIEYSNGVAKVRFYIPPPIDSQTNMKTHRKCTDFYELIDDGSRIYKLFGIEYNRSYPMFTILGPDVRLAKPEYECCFWSEAAAKQSVPFHWGITEYGVFFLSIAGIIAFFVIIIRSLPEANVYHVHFN